MQVRRGQSRRDPCGESHILGSEEETRAGITPYAKKDKRVGSTAIPKVTSWLMFARQISGSYSHCKFHSAIGHDQSS